MVRKSFDFLLSTQRPITFRTTSFLHILQPFYILLLTFVVVAISRNILKVFFHNDKPHTRGTHCYNLNRFQSNVHLDSRLERNLVIKLGGFCVWLPQMLSLIPEIQEIESGFDSRKLLNFFFKSNQPFSNFNY